MNSVASLQSEHTLSKSVIAGFDAANSVKSPDSAVENMIDRVTLKNPFNFRKGDASHDGASLSANIAEHLKNSPLLDKLNGLIAGALMVSGMKTIYSGIREKDREKFLLGSKQTMWGAYHGLNTIETLFKTSLTLAPGLRVTGGFINADLGITALYKDFKSEGALDRDKVIFHLGATAWGLRHLALGAEGVLRSGILSGSLAGSVPGVKAAVSNASMMGTAGAVMGIAGGALDALLGARTLVKGIREHDREKRILGSLDMGIGAAMGVSSVLTGLPAAAVIGAASCGLVYRTWRTDKEEIKRYIKITRDMMREIGEKVKSKFREIFEKPAGTNSA